MRCGRTNTAVTAKLGWISGREITNDLGDWVQEDYERRLPELSDFGTLSTKPNPEFPLFFWATAGGH